MQRTCLFRERWRTLVHLECTVKFLTHSLAKQRMYVALLLRLVRVFLFTAAVWQLQHGYCKFWSLPFTVFNKYDEVIVLYTHSERGTGPEGEKAVEMLDHPVLFCVFSSCLWNILQIQTFRLSVTLIWCWYDCLQVVFRCIFAENCIHVTVKKSH